jgi:Domain of unknown function (DUF4123)
VPIFEAPRFFCLELAHWGFRFFLQLRDERSDEELTMSSLALPNSFNDRQSLEASAQAGQLFALMDPFFELPMPVDSARLETRDTDPVFFEVIAWDQVTYEPPYVAKINPEALQWILNSLSTERWGIFVIADSDAKSLARHFQKFVIAKGPDANPYFLRFHDASVLDVLIQTWEPKEVSVFFGPCVGFGLPDLDTMEIRLRQNPFRSQVKNYQMPKPEDCLLQLRDPQLRLCGEAIDRDLVKVIYWHLRNHHSRSVQFLDKAVLENRIQFAIAKARRYSLGTVSDLAGFTALMFELAPNFDEHPSFRSVLLDPSVPPEAKLRRLSQTITDKEWKEAMGLYDRSFWQNVVRKVR